MGTESDYLTCGQCLKEFPLQKITLFIQHKKLDCNEDTGNHFEETDLKCYYCPRGFMSAWGLLVHVQLTHSLQIFVDRTTLSLTTSQTKISPGKDSVDSILRLNPNFSTKDDSIGISKPDSALLETTGSPKALNLTAPKKIDKVNLLHEGRDSNSVKQEVSRISVAGPTARTLSQNGPGTNKPSDNTFMFENENNPTRNDVVLLETPKPHRLRNSSVIQEEVAQSLTLHNDPTALLVTDKNAEGDIHNNASPRLESNKTISSPGKILVPYEASKPLSLASRTVSVLQTMSRPSVTVIPGLNLAMGPRERKAVEKHTMADISQANAGGDDPSDAACIRSTEKNSRMEDNSELRTLDDDLFSGESRSLSVNGSSTEQRNISDNSSSSEIRLLGSNESTGESQPVNGGNGSTGESDMDCCDSQGCGVTVIPGSHQDLQKCCKTVLPKKRKRHMEMKHMPFSWSSRRSYARRRLLQKSLASVSKISTVSHNAQVTSAGTNTIFIDVEPDSILNETDKNQNMVTDALLLSSSDIPSTDVNPSAKDTNSVPMTLLSAATDSRAKSLILQPGAVFSIPFSYSVPNSSSGSTTPIPISILQSQSAESGRSGVWTSRKLVPMSAQKLSQGQVAKVDTGGSGGQQDGANTDDLEIVRKKYPTSKPFQCDVCSMAFNQRIHLKKHMSKHTGIKPYKCGECDYSTVERSHLKVHIRIHTGEKPFKCTYCEYATAQNSTLKIHLKRHHGGKMFNCQTCDKTFTQVEQLKEHEMDHLAIPGMTMKKLPVTETGTSPDKEKKIPPSEISSTETAATQKQDQVVTISEQACASKQSPVSPDKELHAANPVTVLCKDRDHGPKKVLSLCKDPEHVPKPKLAPSSSDHMPVPCSPSEDLGHVLSIQEKK